MFPNHGGYRPSGSLADIAAKRKNRIKAYCQMCGCGLDKVKRYCLPCYDIRLRQKAMRRRIEQQRKKDLVHESGV